VLRVVHKPVLRGNPSVARPALPAAGALDDDRRPAERELVEADVALAIDATRLAAPRASTTPSAPVERARTAPAAAAVPAPSPRLAGLFAWLTTPRFLHRNS